MQLVYINTLETGYFPKETIITFEYPSKEQFLFDVYEKYNDLKSKTNEPLKNHCSLEVLGIYLDKYDIDNLETNLFTLEEWFELTKIIKIFN